MGWVYKKVFLEKVKLLLIRGLVSGQIEQFDESFYESLSHTYFGGIPISFYIKYMVPRPGELG